MLPCTFFVLQWKWHICTCTISVIAQFSVYIIVDCSDGCVLLLMRGIIEQITAGSPMVGTPIILVQRKISLGLIKDLCNHAITVQRPLKWQKSRKERWSCRESNPWSLAYRAKCSATELYSSQQQPPLNPALM